MSWSFYLDWRHILAGELVEQTAGEVQARHRLPESRGFALGGAHSAAFWEAGREISRHVRGPDQWAVPRLDEWTNVQVYIYGSM